MPLKEMSERLEPSREVEEAAKLQLHPVVDYDDLSVGGPEVTG